MGTVTYVFGTVRVISMAERVGFEPTGPFWGPPVFETGLINHSSTSPGNGESYQRGAKPKFSGGPGRRGAGVPRTLQQAARLRRRSGGSGGDPGGCLPACR